MVGLFGGAEELFEESGTGLAAVADGELHLNVEVGHGLVEGGNVEERVVAEAAGAMGSFEDDAFDCAFGHVDDDAVAGGGEDAAVAGGAVIGLDAGHALQKDDVVPDVSVVVGVGRVDEAGIGGEAGGADAGSAGEDIDFEAGVVGNDKCAGSEAAVIGGLDGGVGLKRCAVFLGRGDCFECGEGVNRNLKGRGGGAEVCQLAGAGGGDKEVFGHAASVNGEGWFRIWEEEWNLVRALRRTWPKQTILGPE